MGPRAQASCPFWVKENDCDIVAMLIFSASIQLAKDAKRLFGFDERVTPTRKERMVPFQTCSEKFGGLSQKYELCGACNVGSKNMFRNKNFDSVDFSVCSPLALKFACV